MPVQQLTNQFCLLAQCAPGKKKTDYYDSGTKGFVLEVRANGGKTYALRYQDAHGTQRQHKIASYGDITFDKAKREAQRLRSQVTLGGDPMGERKEKKSVPLYSELATQHLAHAKTYQRSYSTTAMYMNNHIVPKWGKSRLTDITSQAVAKWLAEKAEAGLAPATVEKIRVILGRSFELAKQWDMAGSERNPARGLPRKPINNARTRYLNALEVERLLEAAEASRNRQLKPIIELLLLTGARVSELTHAQWKHIDLERREWLIPTSKTGKARYVPLAQPAMDVIGKLPKFKDCPYLLPNPETLKPFVTIKHAWQHARDEAKLPGLRIHDLRHSAASFMINAGIDLFAVGRVLGHADHKSTMRYSHLANDTLLAAVEAGAKKMSGVR